MRRSVAAAVVVASLLLYGSGAGGAPSVPPDGRAEAPSLSSVDPQVAQAILNGASRVTVMLELEGASVAQARGAARAGGRELSTAERDRTRAGLAAGQDRVAAAVTARGGRVTGRYQDAYNGLRVDVPAAAVSDLAALPQVAAVRRLAHHTRDLTRSVPYIDVPAAWTDAGATGEGITIAVIDSGLDYTHAHFGGPGTPQAYTDNNPDIVEPGTFPTAKVVAGHDFVGDDYDADGDLGSPVPAPDPDPLDCDGHGTHVAGIAGGQGVGANGQTYTGPYNSSVDFSGFMVGPGVAPEASLVALKVFGCEGSTDVVIDALERAAELDVDVVNMSLGGTFGGDFDPTAVATNALAEAGIMVVTSAGNEGPSAYMVGAPGSATRALATAALDVAAPTLAAGNIDIGAGIVLSLSNDGTLPVTGEIEVLRNPDGSLSLGCEAAEYAGAAGKIVVTLRGTCDRIARAQFGDAAGAVAVIMVNNQPFYPPFEGPIPNVDIPFLGALPTDQAALVAADGQVHTISPTSIPNPGYQALAGFSAGGPRSPDDLMKPDVTAPGVSILSAGVGSGNGPAPISGTSQASPHNAGVAALVRQVHPDWTPEQVKAAIMNTADTSTDVIQVWDPRLAGSGVTRADRAVSTAALATTGPGQASLSYGYEELGGAYEETKAITLTNLSGAPITYSLAASFVGDSFGAEAQISPASVTVAAGSTATVNVTLRLSAAEVAALPAADEPDAGQTTTIRGGVTATPTSAAAPGVYPLIVPFGVTPKGLSNVTVGSLARYVEDGTSYQTSIQLTNGGIHAGTADFYAWGLSDPAGDAFPRADLTNVGVQAFPLPDGDTLLVFAVAFAANRSTASAAQVELEIDTTNDSHPEFTVLGVDEGLISGAGFSGIYGSFVFDAEDNPVAAEAAFAPTNSSVVLLPVLASTIGVTAEQPWFRYSAESQSFEVEEGASDEFDDVRRRAPFNIANPALTTGDFVPLAPGATATVPLTIDREAFRADRPLGWLVVTFDDAGGAAQADAVPVGRLPRL